MGILPADFQSPPQLGLKTPIELYLTASYSNELQLSRGDHEVNVVARLKPGVTLASAQAALNAVSANLATEYPQHQQRQFPGRQIALLRDDLAAGVKQSRSGRC